MVPWKEANNQNMFLGRQMRTKDERKSICRNKEETFYFYTKTVKGKKSKSAFLFHFLLPPPPFQKKQQQMVHPLVRLKYPYSCPCYLFCDCSHEPLCTADCSPVHKGFFTLS